MHHKKKQQEDRQTLRSLSDMLKGKQEDLDKIFLVKGLITQGVR
jgi:hypothetical protein